MKEKLNRREAFVLYGAIAFEYVSVGLGFELLIRKGEDIAYIKNKAQRVRNLLAQEIGAYEISKGGE